MGAIHCKHYRGREMIVERKPCAAGVDPILSFCDGDRSGWVKRAPCFKANLMAPHCPARVFPTEEEIAAKEAVFRTMMGDFVNFGMPARAAIVAVANQTRADSGVIDCPKCGSKLRWSRARSNGHIHAQCETADCLGWME